MIADFQKRHIKNVSILVPKLGRIGFAARGVTWLLVGFFGFVGAVSVHKTKDQGEALRAAFSGAPGLILLCLMTIGIFCYSIWRLFEGFYGINVDPSSSRFGQLLRGYVIPFGSAIFYSFFGISLIIGMAHPTHTSGLDWMGKFSGNVAGSLLLTSGSLVLFGVAVAWLVEVAQRRFERVWDQDVIDSTDFVLGKTDKRITYRVLVILASVGTFGRAFLFMLLSGLIMRVAWGDDVKRIGFGEALGQLQGSVWGRALLGVTSLLLMVFGIYSMTLSRYKKFVFYGGKFRDIGPIEGEVVRIEDFAQAGEL